MKKLFLLASLLSIFFFLAGCQSESPVAPVQTDTLAKPGVDLQLQLSVSGGAYLYSADWTGIGGAKSYEFSYTDPDGNKTVTGTYPAEGGVKNYSALNKALGNGIEGTYTFTVSALDGKGNVKSSIDTLVNFPWLAVTGINCDFQPGPGSINVIVSWDAYPGSYIYSVYLMDMYNGTIDMKQSNSTSYGFNIGSQYLGTQIKVRVDALDISGVIGMGVATYQVPAQ